MVTLTEEERSYLFSEIMRIYQDYNYRSIEGDLLKSILDKIQSTSVTFTQQERSRIQYFMNDLAEVRAGLTNVRLQHILAQHNNQGFGMDHGAQEHYFNAAKQYKLSKSIISKLS